MPTKMIQKLGRLKVPGCIVGIAICKVNFFLLHGSVYVLMAQFVETLRYNS